MVENTYGIRKRLDFIAGVISRYQPSRVLDMGCGTGQNLTALLADRFRDIRFVGVDSDAASIAFARRENRCGNALYALEAEAGGLGDFDLVIASEVIEHVEDPEAFLDLLKDRLTLNGKVILTLPNGHGPFELASLVETVLQLTGIYGALRAVKQVLHGASAGPPTADTLAVSPHINFFSYRLIRSLITACGFKILEYRPRTFLCGFGFDQVMKSGMIISWNAAIAERLPPQMVSDWMFLLEAGGGRLHSVYRRTACAQARRYLNERRWKRR